MNVLKPAGKSVITWLDDDFTCSILYDDDDDDNDDEEGEKDDEDSNFTSSKLWRNS